MKRTFQPSNLKRKRTQVSSTYGDKAGEKCSMLDEQRAVNDFRSSRQFANSLSCTARLLSADQYSDVFNVAALCAVIVACEFGFWKTVVTALE